MRSAHWIRRTHLFRPDEHICSMCGASGGRPYQICPSCGAVMKRAKHEPSWVDEAERLSALLDEDS